MKTILTLSFWLASIYMIIAQNNFQFTTSCEDIVFCATSTCDLVPMEVKMEAETDCLNQQF